MAITPFGSKDNFNSYEFNLRINEMNKDTNTITDNMGNLATKITSVESSVTTLTNTVSTLQTTVAKKTEKFGPTTVSVPVGSWSGSGPWTQTVAVSGVLSTDTGLGVYPVDIADATQRKAYNEAYACLAVEAQTVSNGIVLTCRDKKPTITFNIIIKGIR